MGLREVESGKWKVQKPGAQKNGKLKDKRFRAQQWRGLVLSLGFHLCTGDRVHGGRVPVVCICIVYMYYLHVCNVMSGNVMYCIVLYCNVMQGR